MDALKQQLLKVQQQLAGLSASQKMLTASLLVIMVMTLFYWSNLAGTSEMEAVIDSPLSGDDLAAVQNAVTAKGVKYEVRGGKVYVPVGKRADVTAAMDQLGYDGKLPTAYNKAEEAADSGFGFESQSVRDERAQEKRRRRVENMIARWPDVKAVTVILAGTARTGIMHDDKPTASVSIELKGEGRDFKKLVQSIRKQVVGAQPGLKTEDISVTLDGQSYDSDNPNDAIANGDSQLALKSRNEKIYKQALLEQLRDIPGVRATVTVRLNTNDVVMDEHIMDPKNTAVGLKHETGSEESTPLPPANGEPGATANMGVNADPNAAAVDTAAKVEKHEKTNEVQMSYKNRWTKAVGGEALASTAVVSVPESYFRKIWEKRNAAAKREPTEAEVQATMDVVLPRIRETVKLAVNITDDKSVQVGPYFDFEPVPVADPTAGAGLAALPTGSGFGAKEIAVGALAVISLFMVSMMVRKSAPPQVVMASMPASATAPLPEHSALLTVGDVVGEVAEGTMTLAGHELSEEAIESKQVIEQVGTMVKQNPDIAADLVKRWLTQH